MTEPDEAPPPGTLPPESSRPDVSTRPNLSPLKAPPDGLAPEARPQVALPRAPERPPATPPQLPQASPSGTTRSVAGSSPAVAADPPRGATGPSPVLPWGPAGQAPSGASPTPPPQPSPKTPAPPVNARRDPPAEPARGAPRAPPTPPPPKPPDPPTDARRDPRPGPPPRPPRNLLAWLTAAALLVLAGAQVALWVDVLALPTGSGALDARVQAIDARVTRLEQRPGPPDIAPLQARVAALEQRPATGVGSTAAVAPSPDLGPLEARIAALEQRAPVTTAPNSNDSLTQRLAADEGRLATLEKAARDPAQLADRTNRIGRIQAAFIALSIGQPLGALPGAPPALARYASAAPPTEAALRLAFPAVVRAALAAGHKPSADAPFLTRVWAEAQDVITIRQGDHVVIGDPAAGVLAHAQTALDAGDLAAAAAAVASLSGPAAQALAPWLDQAHGLLAARAALADLASQT